MSTTRCIAICSRRGAARKRDGRTLTFAYDALNRLSVTCSQFSGR